MLSPKLTACSQCSDVNNLIAEIDCKIFEMSQILYNNIVFILNKKFNDEVMIDLLRYKRILMYKICNPDYAGSYTVNMIASRIKILKFK
jgi:hypothetical protein